MKPLEKFLNKLNNLREISVEHWQFVIFVVCISLGLQLCNLYHDLNASEEYRAAYEKLQNNECVCWE